MNARDRIAQQIGQLVIGNIEQQTHIEQLQAELEKAQQRLHDAAADSAGPSGQVKPPNTLRGD
jgi:hypothetical protein